MRTVEYVIKSGWTDREGWQLVSTTLPGTKAKVVTRGVIEAQTDKTVLVIEGEWDEGEHGLVLMRGPGQLYSLFYMDKAGRVRNVTLTGLNAYGLDSISGELVYAGTNFSLRQADWGYLLAPLLSWTPGQYLEHGYWDQLASLGVERPPQGKSPDPEAIVRSVNQVSNVVQRCDSGEQRDKLLDEMADGICRLLRRDDPASPFVGLRELKGAGSYIQQIIDRLRNILSRIDCSVNFPLLMTSEERMEGKKPQNQC